MLYKFIYVETYFWLQKLIYNMIFNRSISQMRSYLRKFYNASIAHIFCLVTFYKEKPFLGNQFLFAPNLKFYQLATTF